MLASSQKAHLSSALVVILPLVFPPALHADTAVTARPSLLAQAGNSPTASQDRRLERPPQRTHRGRYAHDDAIDYGDAGEEAAGPRRHLESNDNIPETLTCTVAGVVDGDTLIGTTEEGKRFKLRLYGIDAPDRTQPYGLEARIFLVESTKDQTVIAEIKGIDPYDRYIARVTLSDGTILNESVVAAGMAHWYEQVAPEAAVLERLQLEAQAAKRGLWEQPSPVPPWKLRELENRRMPRAILPEPSSDRPESIDVYIASGARNYHRGNCTTLPAGRIRIELERATNRYQPCPVCRPPR